MPDFTIIARGKEGQWDNIALLQAHAFANVGEQTYLWNSHFDWDYDDEFRNNDIGLATLHRNGFGYLSAQKADAPANCETACFDAREGETLFINADGVGIASPLTIELLDKKLKIIGGANATKSGTRIEAIGLPKRCVAARVSFTASGMTQHFSDRIRYSPSMSRKADMQCCRLFILAFGLCAICCRTAQPSERVLFAFDDHSIPWQHNLKLTLVPATKHPGNPVLRRGPEGAPDHGHAVLYGTVIKEGGKFRMWYLGMFETHLSGGHGGTNYWRPMCYAESTDGVHWTKPDLGLVEFNGSKNNNICLIEGELFSLTRVNDFLSVLHDPTDPDPAKRYKVAYIAHVPYDDIKGGMSKLGKKEKRVGSTICATSADGLTWSVVGDRPANAGGERFEVSGLYRFGDFYYTTGQLLSPWAWRADGSDIERSMWVYRSSDFKTWSQAKALAFARPGQLVNPPIPDQRTHMGAGMWNRGNVLVGLYGIWQNAAVPPAKGEPFCKGVHIDLGLIISNDGIHFREPVADFKVIARGKEGEWDDVALLQGHAFVNEGDRTMIWYSHWNTGGKPKDRDVGMDIGLATLRRDGLGYLSRKQDDDDAEFITSTFTAGRLSVNVDGITPEAPLTVDLLDHLDRPIAGYAATITRNGTQQPLVWPKALPAAQKLALRAKFPINSTARVYAIYLND